MDLRSRIERQLNKVREVTETLLSAFQTPEQWTFQVHDQANHALWVAGHLGTVDNFLVSRLAPGKAVANNEYQQKFGMGSRPTSDPVAYPSSGEVLGFMRERRRVMLGVLASLSDPDLAAPAPKGTPDVMPDVGSIFEMAVWHEALHLGQVTVARRALGVPPLVDGPR